MKLSRILSSLVFLLLLLFVPFTQTQAATKTGENVIVKPNEVISESLYTTGNTIVIDGTVEGDVVCAGQKITVRGMVEGDVICTGQNITIAGPVNGNVRVAGQNITLSDQVARNVMAFGQSISVDRSASVSGELLFAGQNTTIDGTVGRDVRGGGQEINILGKTGPVTISAQDVTVGNSASIAGSLVYKAPHEASIASSASILGDAKFTQMKEHHSDKPAKVAAGVLAAFYIIAKIVSFTILIIACLLAALCFPKWLETVSGYMMIQPGKAAIWGIIGIIIVPIIAILLFITILGIPLSLLLLLLYCLFFLLARVLVSYIVGRKILSAIQKKKEVNPVASILIGVVVVWIFFQIPVIGWLASSAAVIWGFGGLLMWVRKLTREV